VPPVPGEQRPSHLRQLIDAAFVHGAAV